MEKKKVKYALVLSGGGFKGAFQLGALNYLNDHWQKITGLSGKMKFDIIAGVSVGAINGAMLACDNLNLLNELWLEKIAKNGVGEIYTSDFIDTNHKGDDLKMKLDLQSLAKRFCPDFRLDLSIFKKLGLIFSKANRKQVVKDLFKKLAKEIKSNFPKFKALADNTPLQQKLYKLLHQNKIKDTEFLCGFVSLDTGEYQCVKHSDFLSNEDFIKGVVSSSCIPMVWEPVRHLRFIKNYEVQTSRYNIDGGVKNISPLGDVVKQINADKEDCDYKIIIINCHSGVNKTQDFYSKNIFQIAARSLYDIAFTEIFNNDVKHFLKINDLVKQAQAWDHEIELFDSGTQPIRSFDAIVIQPDKKMDLGNGLVANEKLIKQRTHYGRKMARKAFRK